MRARWWQHLTMGLLLLLLAGCYLVSGERTNEATPKPEGVGEWAVSFVSADGEREAEFSVGRPDVPVYLEVTAYVEWGELSLEFPSDEEEESLVVEARYGRSAQGRVTVRSDGEGLVHLRVTAIEARDGSYTVHYRFQAPPTPTPTPTVTPTPTLTP